jgi:hypothetical protein
MATNYICSQCGVQYAASEESPQSCPICEDERQYINWHGQQWTTLEELRQKHTVLVKPEGMGIYGVGNEPSNAIGQRALLLQTSVGNILWDCVTVLDDAGIKAIQGCNPE